MGHCFKIKTAAQLWSFLESDAETKIAEIEQGLISDIEMLKRPNLEFLDEQDVSYRHLQTQNTQTLMTTHTFLKACKESRDIVVSAIEQHKDFAIPLLPRNPVADIKEIIQQLIVQKKALEAMDIKTKIAELEAQKLALEYRQKLGQNLPQIEQFINDCKWVSKAMSSKVQRSTRHISKMYNQLFSELVTQRYIELFKCNLTPLNCPLSVKVHTKARKGETLKQIIIETDQNFPASSPAVDKVLSEGEQRAVALADFLTEVSLDDNCRGVVLDDPVTSLDFGWKEAIAPILVEESKRRQVIIFTHDLHFLYCVKERALEEVIELYAHWIEKRNGRPGWVFLNNSPVIEKEYKSSKKVENLLQQAKQPNISSERQQRLLREGFGALRTCYEAFVIFELFSEVVLRFGERISIDRLRNVVIDPSIRDTVIQKVGQLSRYIEGHLHSNTFLAQKPTVDMLFKEITDFNALKKRHKELKKSMGIKN